MLIKTIDSVLKHKNTIIILHGLNQSIKDLKDIINKLTKHSKNTKIIIPQCKKMIIKWPDGKQEKLRSWYNYYTRNDNLMKHDLINSKQFDKNTKIILDIIEKEFTYNNNIKVSLCGISQGGTVAINAAIMSKYKLEKIICIDTIFLNNYNDLNIIDTKHKQKFKILSSLNDKIYNFDFQLICYSLLNANGHDIDIKIRNCGHCENYNCISNFIYNNI